MSRRGRQTATGQGTGTRGSLRLPTATSARVYDWLRGSTAGLVFLALVVGAGAGVGAIIFRYLILGFTLLFSGHNDYSATGRAAQPFFSGAANPHVAWLGPLFVVLAPAVAGLIYGPLIARFAPEARGHGVPEVMLAVAERGGRISPAVAIVKSLASALCIGGGGSVGREGPIVQIGSALGSTLGQAVRVPDSRLRLLVACGAAGGISATFNAPIAGVFFGLELILRDFETEAFGVVVLSSITAAVIGRAAFGARAFLTLPAFHLVSYWEYLLYAVLGVLAAAVGIGFVRVLYGLEDLADRVWRGPDWLRPGVGGLLLGLLLLALPQMYGVGYPVLQNGIRGEYVVWFLLVLLVAKAVATSLTIARGPGEARPFNEALGAQATTRVYATPSALRHAVEGGAPPRTGRRIAAQVDAARARHGADAPLGLAALALPPDAAVVLDLVCRHPLLTTREVATAAAQHPASVPAALVALGRHGLVTAEAVAGARTRAYVATARGLRLRALAAGLDPTTYARATGALAETGRAKSGGARRRRFLRGTPEHTRGVNAAYLSFLQATRVAGGALEWWGEWACTRTFNSEGEIETLRPDAYGELAWPGGRLSFYVEIDRGTTQAWRLGRKLALYERYRLRADAPPFAVLLVLRGMERAADIISVYRVARGRAWEPGALDVRSTTARALAISGPLAPIWRDPTGGGGLCGL